MAERSFKAEVEHLRLGAGDTFTGEGILAITKALLESGVGYVGGYQGAPISHLMDVLADAQDLLGELGVRFEANANEAAVIQMIKDRNGYIGCGVDQRVGTGADVIGWLYKIDSTGKPYWENTYKGKYMNVGNQYNTSFFGIDTTDDGGYIIGGSTMHSLHNQVGVLLRTDEFGCLIDQCDTRYITGFGALSNRVGLGLSLFPNPANSHVTLTLDGVEINKVYHYSITGL